ncbi:MAG: DNRLRE domain-containing protein [Anaerolineae bacterium]|nr:DNRLRE domain-containing protein [Anaerolineae bacterium]
MKSWLRVIKWSGLLVTMALWGFLSKPEPAKAQAPVFGADLPPTQSMCVEHVNGVTSVFDDAIKVGNLPAANALNQYTFTDILSDTVYYRTYLRFNVSRIPYQSTVLQARLLLNVERFDYGYSVTPAPGSTLECGVYPVAEPWQPTSTARWDELPQILTDTVAHTTFAFGQTGSYTVDVTSLVQIWVDGAPNYGMMVGMHPDPDDVGDFTAVIYGPAEAADILRPRLVVTYQEPPTKTVYLPLVSYDGRPDLVITDIQLDPLQVSIANQGRGEAGAFWLDVGVDPQHLPVVNQVWHEWGSAYGAAWQVPALGSGESIVLTVGDAWYNAGQSRWPEGFNAGEHQLWAYVDSWGLPYPWGGVDETREDNNRYGPLLFTAEATSGFIAPQHFAPIPPRPQLIEGGMRR